VTFANEELNTCAT